MNEKLKTLAIACALALSASFTAHAQQGALKIEKPWARATAPGAAVGGGYLTVHNPGAAADRLVAASSPAAARMELHEMAMEKDVMKMREVKAMEVPAGGKLELKPGSYHLMFMSLKAPFKQGDKVPVTLKFEKAGEVKVELAVESMGAGMSHGAGHGSAKDGAHGTHGAMKKH